MGNLENVFGDEGQETAAGNHKGAFVVWAPGWYDTVISGAELKETRAGGSMVVITFGNQAGDTVKTNLNIKNANKGCEIGARATLAHIAQCIGINLTDTPQLIGQKITIKVKVTEFKSNLTGKMLPSNDVTDYKVTEKGQSDVSSQPATDAPW